VLVKSVLDIRRYEANDILRLEEYEKATRWAGNLIPQESLVASSFYCGLVKYHIDRPSIRFDVVTPEQWSVIKGRVIEKGYQLYALVKLYETGHARPKIPGKWTLVDTFNNHTALWRIDPE
jgi:hypothetical protein